MWPTGYPDFPMPRPPRGSRAEGLVTISCQVPDLEFTWHLTPRGDETIIHVTVPLPDREAHRLDGQREVITASLPRLAALAERATATP